MPEVSIEQINDDNPDIIFELVTDDGDNYHFKNDLLEQQRVLCGNSANTKELILRLSQSPYVGVYDEALQREADEGELSIIERPEDLDDENEDEIKLIGRLEELRRKLIRIIRTQLNAMPF